MTQISRTIYIEAPVDKVFSYVSKYQNWPTFYEGISDVRPITETTDATGSKFIYKTKVQGKQFTIGTEFRDFVKNKGWNGKSFKGIEHRTQWIFEEDGRNTKFTHGIYYKLPVYMGGKLMDVLIMKSAWKKIIDNSLRKLKKIMESG